MESEFDNIKEVDYYNSRNFYPSDESATSNNSHGIDAKQLRWTPNDHLNNIINEDVKQTSTTTTTTTTTTTNNGQFDDNLLYSSDNIDLNQKIPSPASDDNNLHHASTLENNGEELLAAGYDNKIEHSTEFDNDQKKLLEKIQPHQQLGDTDADYGPETCVDVTDDVVMMTENSADTNNLLEQSTLSHSKDTLPSSDNCNPFDNKNTLDMEDGNEFQLGGVGADAHLQLDDENKSTPLLSPEVEDLPLSSEGGLQFTNEGFQQSPLDDNIPLEIGSHQRQIDFEDEFMQSNGHLSPIEVKNTNSEKLDIEQKTEEQEDKESLVKLEKFGDPEEETVVLKHESNEKEGEDVSHQQTDLNEDLFGNVAEQPELQQKENVDNIDNDEADFRLKDEEEILEKHVESSLTEKELKEEPELALNQRDELQQTLQNLEDDVLEEKPILTGSFTEKQLTEINFDDLSMQPDEEKLNDFAEEKQDSEEFSEKEGNPEKLSEKLSFIEQKSAPGGEIKSDEDDCIHLEEDVRPSDYLAVLERQKGEQQQQQLSKVIEGFERDEEETQIESYKIEHIENEKADDKDEGISENEEQVVEKEHHEEDNRISENVPQSEKSLFVEDYKLSDKVDQLSNEQDFENFERLNTKEEEDEKLSKLEEEHEREENEKLDERVELIEENEHYDIDESLSVGTEQLEQERHLDDIEVMSQQFDRFEKEDQAEDQQNAQLEQGLEDTEKQAELNKKKELYLEETERLCEQLELLEELKKELQEEEAQVNEDKEEKLNQETEQPFENNKLDSEIVSLTQEHSPLVEDSIAQPEKQCFEEPEKLPEETTLQQEIDNLKVEENIVEEPVVDEDSFEGTEKQLVECTEKQLSKIEQQVLDTAAALREPKEAKPIQIFEEDPDSQVEVVEELIIKEQVKTQPNPLAVSSQEPSTVPPTHESCDESEDDEWKYTKEGQGEKQLLGLQGDTVVEEELQPQLQEAGAFSVDEHIKLAETISEQISNKNAPEQIETIKDTFDLLTQNLVKLAESAAENTEPALDKISDAVEDLNISQSSTREKLDNIEDDDISASEMNSKLNPEAKEFVPTFSPTGVELANGFGIPAPTAIPTHFKDELLAQSPRKGRESNMENINIPAENEFEEEIAHKPHGLLTDEAIVEHAENGGLYQEMNWKEAMHGSEKEEGPLVDSPVTEESLEVVDNVLQYGGASNLCDFTAPVDLDNAGMKQSIYIENNSSLQSNTEDDLNTVQFLPVEDNESKENSFEAVNDSKEDLVSIVQPKDAVTKDDVEQILNLASNENKELSRVDDEIENKMEQLLLSHDKEIIKDIQLETQQVPINGVEMSPTSPKVELIEQLIPTADLNAVSQPIVELPQEPAVKVSSSPVPVAEEALETLSLGAAAAVAVATTTAAVKKVEAEKNQKNLNKTSSATKSKVPDTKKPVAGTTAKTSTASTVAAKRTLGDKPKPGAASSLATKKTVGSTSSIAPRPRTAPAAGGVKTPTDKKTTPTTTSTAKSRIDTKPPSTLAARKPLASSATRPTTSKLTEDSKSSSTTIKSSNSSKISATSKSILASTRTTTATNSIARPRPATASSAGLTNGTASKTAASKPTTLAPKSATHIRTSLTSPRGTLTSTLRKTEAIKSPTKTTSSTITSRVNNGTNGTKTTTTTRTTTSKTTLSTVPTAAARSTGTTTTTTRRSVTGTSSTIGATTPTSKTNNLVPRKSTPLKKTITNSSSTPTARKSIGSKLNATKPTKDTTTPRPVTIPAHLQINNSIAAAEPKDTPLVPNTDSTTPVDGELKLNGIVSLDDVTLPTAPVAHPLEMEIA